MWPAEGRALAGSRASPQGQVPGAPSTASQCHSRQDRAPSTSEGPETGLFLLKPSQGLLSGGFEHKAVFSFLFLPHSAIYD